MFYSEEAYNEAMDSQFNESLTQGELMVGACREYARNVGHDCPDVEWISTNFDTWERNPFFTGVPGRHPEAEDYDLSDVDDHVMSDEENDMEEFLEKLFPLEVDEGNSDPYNFDPYND